MDSRAFDTIAQALSGSATRRGGIRAAIGAALALRGAAATAAASSAPETEGPCGNGSNKDNRCQKSSDCCTGICDLSGSGKAADAQGKHHGKGKGKGKGKHKSPGLCRCLASGKSCTEDRNCCGGMTCIDGACGRGKAAKPVRTGRACSPQDTCADSRATCSSYQWGSRAGGATYCLLATGADCTGDQQCPTNVCSQGICALCSIAACGEACSPIVCASGCEFTTVQDAITARQGTPDNVVAIGAGTWQENLTVTSDVVLRACRGSEVILKNASYFSPAVAATGGAALSLLDIVIDGFADKGGGNWGGGIYAEGDLTLAGATVIRNSAWDKGGAIYAASAGKTITITDNALIENNACSNRGGGVLVEGESDLVVTESAILRANSTDSYGGALAAVDGANVAISGNVRIENNTGGGAGLLVYRGATSTRTISVVVEGDVPIDGNISGNGHDGGFARFQNTGDGTYHEMDIRIRDRVRITNNTMTTPGDGGALSSRWGKITLSGSVVISGNEALDDGGAIWISPAFDGKHWPDGVTGLTIEDDVTITGNTAPSGGAIYAQGTSCALGGNALVSGNTGVYGGGFALTIYNGDYSPLTITGAAAITGNTATNPGGGIWSDDAGNTVTGGAAVTGNTPDNCSGTTC